MFSHMQHRLTGVATALLLGASLAFAAPAGAAESMDTNKCTDAAWASYNSCLVSSAGYEWAMRECDFAFEQDYGSCYSGVIGFFAKMLSK